MFTDTVAHLMASASRHPVPSKAEQLSLGYRIQAGRKPDATEREKRVGLRAKQRLMAGNYRLAITVASRYRARIAGCAGLDFEDLIQESAMGLSRAADKFDPCAGYAFSTYSYWWCQQAVGRAIEVYARTIRTPIDVQSIDRKWRYRPSGQSLDAFCEQHKLKRQRVLESVEACSRTKTLSLDVPIRGKDAEASDLGEMVAAPIDPDADDIEAFRAALESMADWLPDDLALIELNHSGIKQTQLAELEGLSRSAIGVHVKRAKQRLQDVVDADTRLLLTA